MAETPEELAIRQEMMSDVFDIEYAINSLGILGVLSKIHDILDADRRNLATHDFIKTELMNIVTTISNRATTEGESELVEFSAARKQEIKDEYFVEILKDRS